MPEQTNAASRPRTLPRSGAAVLIRRQAHASNPIRSEQPQGQHEITNGDSAVSSRATQTTYGLLKDSDRLQDEDQQGRSQHRHHPAHDRPAGGQSQ